jgi:hypothetical protein
VRSSLREVRNFFAARVSIVPRHFHEQMTRVAFQRLKLKTGRLQTSQGSDARNASFKLDHFKASTKAPRHLEHSDVRHPLLIACPNCIR